MKFQWTLKVIYLARNKKQIPQKTKTKTMAIKECCIFTVSDSFATPCLCGNRIHNFGKGHLVYHNYVN